MRIENLDCQSFGRKVEINNGKGFKKPQFQGLKGRKNPSKTVKSHKKVYDKSIEGENSSKTRDIFGSEKDKFH